MLGPTEKTCHTTIECSVRLECAPIALCRADKISAVALSPTRRVNITASRPLHDASSPHICLVRLNATEFDRQVGETIALRRSWPVKCEDLTT